MGVGKLYILGHPRQTVSQAVKETQSHGERPISDQSGRHLPGREAEVLNGALNMAQRD